MPNTKVHPHWCFFCVRCCSFTLQHTQTMKRHPCWCSFVFGIVPAPHNICRARNHTLVGVFSCSVLFPCLTTHARHENTPLLVSFRFQHCSFILQHTPNTTRHQCGRFFFGVFFSILPHMPSTTTHLQVRWCYFVLRSFLPPSRVFINLVYVLLNTYCIY